MLIHLNDLLDDVTFPLLTNQRLQKCDMTKELIDRHLDIMTTYNIRFDPFPDPSAILDSAGGEVLQVVRRCRQ